MNINERYAKTIEYFEREMPIAETELHYTTPFELLVAVILSAQCTDKRVNEITPSLFKAFSSPEKLANADIYEIYEHIKSCSYPNNKAKHLVNMAKMLTSEFNSIIPENIADLEKLPGVGRKTANVILSVIYKKPAIAVDTHVFRVSARIGLTLNAKTPLDTEKQLVKYFPEKLLSIAHHWLILHGRYVCTAKKPKCNNCGLRDFCKEYGKTIKKQLKQNSKKHNISNNE